jgi:hypothetical protein
MSRVRIPSLAPFSSTTSVSPPHFATNFATVPPCPAVDPPGSPTELRQDSGEILRPTIAIKAFSDIRTEEIVRLLWVMVTEPEECIRVPGDVGKVNARRVPMLPNLKQRLARHPDELKCDRVAANLSAANSLYHAWQRFCK